MDSSSKYYTRSARTSSAGLQSRSQSIHSRQSSEGGDYEEDIIEDIELLDLISSAKQNASNNSKYPPGSFLSTQFVGSTPATVAASALASYSPATVTIDLMSTCGGSSPLKSAFDDLVRYLSTSVSKRQNSKKPAVQISYPHGGDRSARFRRNSVSFNSATTRLQNWWKEMTGRATVIHHKRANTRPLTAIYGTSNESNNPFSAGVESDAHTKVMDDVNDGHLPSQRRNAMDLADPDEERRQIFTSFGIPGMRQGGTVSALNDFDNDYIFQSQAAGSDRFQENVDYEQPRIQRLAPCLQVEPQQFYSRSRRNRPYDPTYHTSGPLISAGFTENLRLQAELSVKQQETLDALAVIANKARFVVPSIDNRKVGGGAKKSDATTAEGGANGSSGSFSTIDLATAGVQYLSLSGTSHHASHESLGKKFASKWKEAWGRVFTVSK
ncbi:hypothetical protein POJ06DRAFT_303796 [Lipomyces tetrasporus]|uniref:Uncharacterized protein n=1 Tax=Lipomyces tetrasporus TaxID=54092 RepID=A0AAD7QLN2_9ASCO|nr:uncharacterized protein POJ06DRAFT_303796 [Lipomyces tetrasporus]KAJ8097572.1 hypothetical protein POJ06DRAFT_303796 [Lipomyces tetrasporus]